MLICYGFCGSFCNFERAFAELEKLISLGHSIIPVCSYHFSATDTRFGKAEELMKRIEEAVNCPIITTLSGAEPVGPKLKPDIMVISPCTGNTLAKLACGISDTPVTLAAKAHLRNRRPLVLAVASNDALSANFRNLATLYEKKNVYFVPLCQDDILKKPSSLVCDFSQLEDTIAEALDGRQKLPLFV
ncbi:MAG: dipicolinate synthase subunit B [Ruminococcaceae bacterium]|nr:dipicolinate synthase subunit B [Oscillospiraceae bacterium]